MPRRLVQYGTCALSFAVLSLSALAAEPAPQSSSSSTEAEHSDVVELSPFTVSSESDVGYVATNSLAGSRLNTSLKDTAASISVMTSEFLNDIGAVSLEDAMKWSTNSQLQMQDTLELSNRNDDINSTFGDYGSYRIRGLPATKTRNYFAWRLPTDTYNLDRVEEERGPNSILFGIGNAGGVVNVGTKQALTTKAIRGASVGVSTWGGYRATLDINQPINKQLAVRFNGVVNRREGYRIATFNANEAADFAVTYKVLPKTTIRADYEQGSIRQVIASNINIVDEYSSWVNAGSKISTTVPATNGTQHVTLIANDNSLLNLVHQAGSGGPDIPLPPSEASYTINFGGSGNLRTGNFKALTGIIEQQIGNNTFAQLSFNHQADRTLAWMPAKDAGVGRLYIDTNAYLPGGAPNPHVGQFYSESQTWNWFRAQDSTDIRGTLASELDLKKWGRYRFAGLAEREKRDTKTNAGIEVFDGSPFSSAPEATANIVWHRTYITPGDWDTYVVQNPVSAGFIQNQTEPITGKTLSSTMVERASGSPRDTMETQDSGQLVLQAHELNDRLVIGVGERWDRLSTTTFGTARDPVSQQWVVDYTTPTTAHYNGRTKTFGVVGHVTDWFSLLYNESDSFSLPSSVRILPDSLYAGNPTATGKDVGVSLDLLHHKLYARLSYFKTDLKNGANFSYGGSYTNPSSISDYILNALVDNGYMTNEESQKYRSQSTGATYSQLVKGYELNLVANPTKDWRVQFNWSYTNGYVSEIAPEVQDWVNTTLAFYKSLPAAQQQLVTGSRDSFTIARVIQEFEDNNRQTLAGQGLILPGNRAFKVNVFSSYTFSETALRGLTVGGGYQWQSKMPGGFDNDGTLRWAPGFENVSLMAGYRFRHVPVVKNLKLQLNVDNVLNEKDPYIYRYVDHTSTPYRIRIRDPLTWRLTASFGF